MYWQTYACYFEKQKLNNNFLDLQIHDAKEVSITVGTPIQIQDIRISDGTSSILVTALRGVDLAP